jgi:hypothetical protein
VVPDVPINEFSRTKLAATEKELKEEKAMVAAFLPH